MAGEPGVLPRTTSRVWNGIVSGGGAAVLPLPCAPAVAAVTAIAIDRIIAPRIGDFTFERLLEEWCRIARAADTIAAASGCDRDFLVRPDATMRPARRRRRRLLGTFD